MPEEDDMIEVRFVPTREGPLDMFEYMKSSAPPTYALGVDRIKDFVHVPTFFIRTRDGVHIAPIPWKDENEKSQVIDYVRTLARELDATGVGTIVESWLVKRPMGTDIERLRPSQEADRTEALLLSYRERGSDSKQGYYEIVRDDQGPHLGEFVPLDGVVDTRFDFDMEGRPRVTH